MEVNKVGIFISAFIILLIGIVLLGSTADTVTIATDSTTIESLNESTTLINGTGVALTNNWVTSIIEVLAQNGTANYSLTETTDYTVDNLNSETTVQITLVNAEWDGNTSYVSYNYQNDNYVRSGVSRVLIRLIIIFFAIALLGIAIAVMYQMGLMELFKK